MSLDAVVYGASEVVAVGEAGLDISEDAAIAVVDGEVARIGESGAVSREFPPQNATCAIDARGRTVLPGFVDPHTHALFAGDRSDEFAAKLRGKTYQEILSEGGGILRTVRAVRETSDRELLDNLLSHLDRMLSYGSTTVEVKSGYGLDTETELRMLEVIARADALHPVDLVPTFMGAHAVPEDQDADDYVEEVIEEQLPAVADQGIAEYCDVFCEEGVFDVEQSRRVLEAGEEYGLTPKVHAEELSHLGGTQLAADLGATSADHLLFATEEDAAAVADAGVIPVFLPGTAFSLGAEYADADLFLDAGSPVAVATDFNPNCHSRDMSFAVTLSCVEMGLTPAQAIEAATKNAALAVDRPELGTLQEGTPADLMVVDAPSYVHVPYTFGENLIERVLKGGELVYENGEGVYR